MRSLKVTVSQEAVEVGNSQDTQTMSMSMNLLSTRKRGLAVPQASWNHQLLGIPRAVLVFRGSEI